MINDTAIEQGITAQAKATNNKPVDPNMVKNAFELNKGKMDQAGLDKNSTEYWAQVAGNTSADIGMFNDENDPFNPSYSQRGSRDTRMFKRESYIPFEEELNRVIEKESKKDKEADSRIPKKMNRIEAAKELVKQLKKLGSSKNEIVHSLINRMRLSMADAIKVYDGKEKDIEDLYDWKPTDPLAPPICDESDGDDIINNSTYGRGELNKNSEKKK
jgi:hypothetical protein